MTAPIRVICEHLAHGFGNGDVPGGLGDEVCVIVFEDLSQPRPVRVLIEGHDVSSRRQEILHHPSADEPPRPGDQHRISIAHAAMLCGLRCSVG